MAKQDLLLELREGRPLALRQQTALTLQLSFPAILAQVSSIVMQYIDAAMVGQLGRDASAAIGLVASSTWLFGGLCRALVVGFSVMVAQRIGAGEEKDARNLVKQGLCAGFAFGLLIAAVGGAIASGLPHWLHADSSICPGASSYFLIFALSLPFVQLNRLAVGLLQAGGNMRTPSILLVLMCGLDVVFNSLLIFPTRQLGAFTLPGADLGVTGAALGTALSETVVAIILCICLLRSPMLGLRKGERLRFVPVQLRRAVRLGAPVAIEQAVMSSAQVVTTRIRRAECRRYADRTERRCQAEGFGDAAGLGDGAAGHGRDAGGLRADVRAGPVDHRDAESRPAGGAAGHAGAADRCVFRAAVRRVYCDGRCFSGGGQLTAQLRAELCQYVGRAYHADAAVGAPLGAAGSVDRHVHRAVLPRFTVFILPVAQTVAAAGAGVKEKSRVTESVTRDFWVEGGYGGRFRLRGGGKSGMIEKTRKGEPP